MSLNTQRSHRCELDHLCHGHLRPGSMNSSVLSGARVGYAMARDGIFFKMSKHPPEISHARPLSDFPGHSCGPDGPHRNLRRAHNLLFLPPGFLRSAVLALFRMRKTEPDLPRPYRCWGYPGSALFVAGALARPSTFGSSAPAAPRLALLLILAGLPFYRRWNRSLSTAGNPPASERREEPSCHTTTC